MRAAHGSGRGGAGLPGIADDGGCIYGRPSNEAGFRMPVTDQ